MPSNAYLRFDHPNVGYVLDGQEEATVRYGFERDLAPGDTVALRTPGGVTFAVAKVADVWASPVRLAYHDITVSEGRNHPADNAIDLHMRLNGHYPDAEITPDTEVTVIAFDVIAVGGADAE